MVARSMPLLMTLFLGGGLPVLAQTQTGGLTLQVQDPSGRPLAGVRVELRSPRLPGLRVGLTDASGLFRAPLLPPGPYTGTLSREGHVGAQLQAQVLLGVTSTVEARLRPATSGEAVVEVRAADSKQDPTAFGVRENFEREALQVLPVTRDLNRVAALVPGVTRGVKDRVVIAGAGSFENQFLVNGVDINDNFFNTPLELYIEDAVEETQVLTGNVGAEFGRFMGGVVSALTRRGGNAFSGAYRVSLENEAWSAVRPLQDRSKLASSTNAMHTLTFGGPVFKDRLWFFLAGRTSRETRTRNLVGSGVGYTPRRSDDRFEANLTWQLNDAHRLSASYLTRVEEVRTKAPYDDWSADPKGLHRRREPLSLRTLGWDALVNSNWWISLSLSQKRHHILKGDEDGNGGTAFWQSPVGDENGYTWNNHDFGNAPEDRNNDSVKLVSTHAFEALGHHELKWGLEQFREISAGANPASPTGCYIYASASHYDRGAGYRGVTFDFDSDYSYLEDWSHAPGGTFRSESRSFFLQDTWGLGRLSLNLGLRLENWKGDAGSYHAPSYSEWVPRLGLGYDLSGEDRWRLQAGFAEYTGKANMGVLTMGTYVGNPSNSTYAYVGSPELGVSAGPNSPGFRRTDYAEIPRSVMDPARTNFLDGRLRAPLTREWTLGLRHRAGERGSWTLLARRRDQTRMYEDYVGSEGLVELFPGLTYPRIRWANAGPEAVRVYESLEATLETTLDLGGGRLDLQANATLSRLRGNYEGDNATTVGGGTPIGNYPQARPHAAPSGRLPNDQPVQVKMLGAWRRALPKGVFTCSAFLEAVSGKPYSHRSYVDSLPNLGDPDGYYKRYWGGRNAGRYPSTYLLDLAVQWEGTLPEVPKVQFFAKATLAQAPNWIQQRSWDVAGDTSPAGTFAPGEDYGKPTTANDYVGNRQMKLEMGLRF